MRRTYGRRVIEAGMSKPVAEKPILSAAGRPSRLVNAPIELISSGCTTLEQYGDKRRRSNRYAREHNRKPNGRIQAFMRTIAWG